VSHSLVSLQYVNPSRWFPSLFVCVIDTEELGFGLGAVQAERSNDKERSERAGRERGVGCGIGIAGEKALVGAALHLRTSPLA
jgi:hypothetical protein